jgi:pyruvate/2-oxoglutarate dehydrogenase complex dihydrolipoamide acyltransferase (E2) component
MSSPDVIGAFDERPFLRSRIPTLAWSHAWHHVPILMEVDVTVARDAIRQQKAETGERTSFTGWVVTCLAQAVSEHPRMHALRNGQRKVVMFRDVDVAVVVERVERTAGRGPESDSLPMPYVIRKANEKRLSAIHAEIRAAQTAPVAEGEVQVEARRAEWKTRLFTMLPRTVRDLVLWRRLRRDPFLAKRLMGTVCVTSVGMMGGQGMSWGIPSGIHPLLVAVGGIAERAALMAGQWVAREQVGLTVSFDHDVTDGAPVARFMARLRDLMERGHGLTGSR